MAISKLVLNGEVQMDVTSDTVTAGSMLSGTTATKNDGTKATGTIVSKSSTDMTVSGATVTAPAGYYANAASKAVATTTHPNPSASITSSTGVVTASHTQGTGYVTGGTTTGTLNLTTQAGKTVTPTESAQTAVASYRWTTGNVNVAAISSTYVGTGVTTRSSANLTASGSVVTAPAGYYSTAATKAVAAGSAFPPAVTITKAPTIGVNTSGVVTASYNGSSSITPTVTSGYVSQGTAGTISTTGTSTYQLTSKAAATYYPSTADQTIASQRWLVGAQTIKSVTTSNLTAENIAEGVTVKVGDSNNASRITQVTGTHSGTPTYTATISGSGNSAVCYVIHNGTKYYTAGNSFAFNAGDILTCSADSSTGSGKGYIFVNDVLVSSDMPAQYTYTLPSNNVKIKLIFSGNSEVHIDLDVDLPFYNIYKTLATTSSISASMENMSEFCNSFSGINSTQFVNRTFSGSFTFENATYVSVAAFGFIPDLGGAVQTAYFSFPKASIINGRAFINNNTLSNINIPLARIIGSSAFYSCGYLENVSSPELITIYNAAFYNCVSLKTIDCQKVTTISNSAFYHCSSLTSINAPNVTSIGSTAFVGCRMLSSVNIPKLGTVANSTFDGCRSLSIIALPSCTSIGQHAFAGCSSLSGVSLPICSYIGSGAFSGCILLQTISLPACTTIGAYAFTRCYNLLSVYLLGSSVISLGSYTAFTSTPIENETTSTGGVHGSIFVPASLYNSYKTATGWSLFSSRFVSV